MKKTPKPTYTVESANWTCGHNHRSRDAAVRCRSSFGGYAEAQMAVIKKDGEQSNGIGLWQDGEPNY